MAAANGFGFGFPNPCVGGKPNPAEVGVGWGAPNVVGGLGKEENPPGPANPDGNGPRAGGGPRPIEA